MTPRTLRFFPFLAGGCAGLMLTVPAAAQDNGAGLPEEPQPAAVQSRLQSVVPGQDGAEELDARTMAIWLMIANEQEIDLARFGAERAAGADVRRYASDLVEAHRRFAQRLVPLAQASPQGPSGEPSASMSDARPSGAPSSARPSENRPETAAGARDQRLAEDQAEDEKFAELRGDLVADARGAGAKAMPDPVAGQPTAPPAQIESLRDRTDIAEARADYLRARAEVREDMRNDQRANSAGELREEMRERQLEGREELRDAQQEVREELREAGDKGLRVPKRTIRRETDERGAAQVNPGTEAGSVSDPAGGVPAPATTAARVDRVLEADATARRELMQPGVPAGNPRDERITGPLSNPAGVERGDGASEPSPDAGAGRDADRPSADPPSADRPAADRPAADRPAADRPAEDRSAASLPMLRLVRRMARRDTAETKDELQAGTGTAFEGAFLREEVASHRRSLTRLETFRDAADGRLLEILQDGIDQQRRHLEEARTLLDGMQD